MGKINNIEWLNTRDLKPYENNTKKHPEKQLRLIEKSIEQFGFISPCLIDENNNLIAGHGRVEAANALGMPKVPCIRVEGLTDDERKAYIIADNRLTELGGWDKELVAAELSALNESDFNIDITGFTITDIKDIQLKPILPYGAERDRTDKAYNLHLIGRSELEEDFWQMPVIENNNFIPQKLIGFNYAKTSKEKDCGIHFYIDDYQFERIWNEPEKYIDVLSQYECILSPDFSLYMDMPMPMKIWNIYRSRVIGSFYQSYGINVIPTISWAEEATFDFCFAGIPKGSVVSISTIGVKEKDEAFEIWKNGVDAMIEKIEPSAILIYGGQLEYDYKDIKVVYYDNQVLKQWKDRINAE